MIRPASLSVVLAVAAFVVTGCQYPLTLVIANSTNEPVTISLRLFAPQSDDCEAPRSLSFMPASDVGRRFREPDQIPAQGSTFDRSLCTVQAVIPGHMALELEFDPLTGYRFAERDQDAQFTAEGAAGTVVLQGPEVRRHFDERSGSFVLEYGAA